MRKPREMSAAQFVAALEEHGFQQELLWLHDIETGISFGMVMDTRGKLLRRASLAKALRGRKEELAKHAA